MLQCNKVVILKSLMCNMSQWAQNIFWYQVNIMSGHHVKTSRSSKVGYRKHGFNPKLAWDIVETYFNASFSSEILWTSWNIWFLENVENIMSGHQKWISARRRVFNFVSPIFVIPIFLSPIRVCLSESKPVKTFLIHTLFFKNVTLSCPDIYARRKTKVEIAKTWQVLLSKTK